MWPSRVFQTLGLPTCSLEATSRFAARYGPRLRNRRFANRRYTGPASAGYLATSRRGPRYPIAQWFIGVGPFHPTRNTPLGARTIDGPFAPKIGFRRPEKRVLGFLSRRRAGVGPTPYFPDSIVVGSLDRRRRRLACAAFFVIATACSTRFSPQTACSGFARVCE